MMQNAVHFSRPRRIRSMLFGVARCSITFGPLFQLDPNRASSSSRCIGANSLGWVADSQFRVVCGVSLVYLEPQELFEIE